MERFYTFVVKRRFAIMLVVLVATVCFAVLALRLPVRISLEKLFPYNHPFVKLNKELGTQFGGTNTMLVMVQSKKGDIFNPTMVKKIKEVTDYFYYSPMVYRSLTASITLSKSKYIIGKGMGEINMAPVFPVDIDNTEKSFSFARDMVFQSPIFNGLLVSNDGKSGLIILEINETVDYWKLSKDIDALKEKVEADGSSNIYFTGRPILLSIIYGLSKEIYIIIGIVISITIVLLMILFRNWIGVLIHLFTAVLCSIWGLGMMSLLKFEMSPLLIILPVLLSTRAISHSLQIFERYAEEAHKIGHEKKELILRSTVKTMMIPNWSGILADVFGFLVLVFVKIALIQEVAISMGLWVFWLAPLSGIFVPILCSYLPVEKGRVFDEIEKTDILDRIPYKIGTFAITRKGVIAITLIFGSLVAFCVVYVPKVQIGDLNPGSSLLFPDSKFNRDTAIINSNFSKAGADALMLFFEGDSDAIKATAVLKYFDGFERNMMENMEGTSRGAWSLVTILKNINTELHDGDPKWSLIPNDQYLNANLMLLFASKNEPSEFARYTDPLYKIGNTILFFKDHVPSTIKKVKNISEEYFKKNPMKIKEGTFYFAGGSIGLEMATTDVVKSSHEKIDLLIYVTIFLLCVISYRSLTAGVFLGVPLVFANVVAIAIMAFMKVGITIDTLPVVALGAGIGVDFGFYFVSRIIEEYKKAADINEALVRTLMTTGKTVIFSGLTMIIPLVVVGVITDIKFQAQMGILIAIILFLNMIWTVTVSPILIHYFEPKFLTDKKGKSFSKRSSDDVTVIS